MLNKKFKKAISAVTMFATVVCLSGVSMLAPLAASAATIVDGDIIKSNATNSDGTPALSSLDVYIVKIVGTKKFKRLVLNPQVFASYGHLKWENIKTVSQAEEDSYVTSSLVRVDGDAAQKVYALTPAGDTGAKSWVNVSSSDFLSLTQSDPESIYTINSVDAGNYATKSDITTVTQLKAFYKDGTLPAPVTDGALKVALSADTPASTNVPTGVGAEFVKFNLTASNAGDVTVDSITLTAGGLELGQNITSIAVYDEDGNRLNTSLKPINTDDEANINVNNFVVKAGTTEEISVKAQVTATKEGIYTLGIDSVSDISSDAASISGSFPIEGNEMNAVDATGLAEITIAADGTPSGVSLGDEGATIARFKATAATADATIYRISLKRNSAAANTASDEDFENLALYVGSTKVATASEVTNRYVTFNISDGILVEEDDTVKMSLRADIVGGAGKNIQFYLDNPVDVEAMGTKFAAKITDSYDGAVVAINAGEVSLVKVNADSLKVKSDTDNVELGGISITANSGEDVNIESLQLTITATGDNNTAVDDEFLDLTGVEIYDATDKATYDLDYISSNVGAGSKVYGNTDLNLEMASGETHELIVRGDTSDTSDGNTYAVSMNATTQLVIKEVADDNVLDDVTPSSVALKKVTVEASGITFAVKTLSTPKTAVAGTEGVEAIRFSIESTSSDVTVNELTFDGSNATAALTDDVVSGFTLYEYGNETPIKTVGTSDLSGEQVTMSDLGINIASGATKTFYLDVDVASGATGDVILDILGYSAEDADGDVYDSTADTNRDGDVNAVTTLVSPRTINIVGTGSLSVSIDNTLSSTKKDTYAVAGTSTENLAALKLKATNEAVDLDSVTVAITTDTASAAGSVFASLSLVDADGKTVATTSNVTNTVLFDDLTYVVETGEDTLYLKGTLNKIGEDETGILNQDNINFAFTVAATGDASGDELIDGDNNGTVDAGEIVYDLNNNGTFDEVADIATGVSKDFGSLATRISAVTLTQTSSYGTVSSILKNGNQVAAIINVTADASSNTTSDGKAVKTQLQTILVNISKLAATTINGITIQNADGDTVAGVLNAGVTTATFTVTGNSDFEITPGSTETFIVKADVTKGGAGESDDYLEVSLDALNATDATANFSWKDSEDAAAKSALRLGTSSLSGFSLDE